LLQGVTVLRIEQNAKLAQDVIQRGYVMERGLIRLTAASAALINDPQLRQAYFGE
jgi:branched-chain amino acid transport system ATP-binding protein